MDIVPGDDKSWHATLNPVYILPLREAGDSAYTGFDRKIYDDQVTMIRSRDSTQATTEAFPSTTRVPPGSLFCRSYPNPFHDKTMIEFNLPEPCKVTISVFDLQGRNLHTWVRIDNNPGTHEIIWDGRDEHGNRIPSGLYYYRINTSTGREQTQPLIIL